MLLEEIRLPPTYPIERFLLLLLLHDPMNA
jgi:hypothetical protein